MVQYGLYGGLAHDAGAAEIAGIGDYLRGLRRSPVPDAASLWGVGQAELPSGIVPLPISWHEIDRDTAWADRMAELMRLAPGQFALYTLNHAQSAQMWPWLHVTFRRKARFATVMPLAWDAGRIEMYTRRFAVDHLFGLSPVTLDGLAAAGHDPIEVMRRIGRISAQPGAWERLAEAGLKPARLTWMGPLLVFDPCDGSGGRFDFTQWELESVDGEIVLTSGPERTARFEREPTGIRGRIAVVEGEPRLFAD